MLTILSSARGQRRRDPAHRKMALDDHGDRRVTGAGIVQVGRVSRAASSASMAAICGYAGSQRHPSLSSQMIFSPSSATPVMP
jgi:hypothetical protein